MENKFKVGDRVRIIGDSTKTEHTIKKITEGYYWLETDAFIGGIWLEKIEPTDPKTAFLSELKELLEKYDAGIYVDFNQSDEIYTTTIAVGEDSVKYNYTDGIDCDNIMDYDKK